MAVVIKAYLEAADSDVEVRRIPVSLTSPDSNAGIFNETVARVRSAFPALTDKIFALKWKDADGDLITMSSDEEMVEATSQSQNAPLKVYIAVEGVKVTEPEKAEPTQANGSQDSKPVEGVKVTSQDSHHFGPMGPCGQPFGPMGRGGHFPDPLCQQGPHFDHHEGHGHHFGSHDFPGQRGDHHYGQFMGMNGPFESHHFFEDQSPCLPSCLEEKHEERNWKAKLRDAVPVVHRRWAKLYIYNWRVQNLKTASSSSSDSEQQTLTIKYPSMPEAYAAWLDIILPKWHKRQAKLDVDVSKDTETDSEERKKLKASVPLEFRKWTKWYLARHFGKKEAPMFRKDASKVEKMDKLHKKGSKIALKMHTLAASVPAEHRVWAEKFIADWRQEHNILEPGAGNVEVLLENETAEKDTGDGSGTVSEYYAKWMRNFLPKWHLYMGQIDAQKVVIIAGERGEFMDNVSMNFRKWVKFFMHQKYGKGAEKEKAITSDNYQKCLQAYHQKWLAEHANEGNIDDLVLTSSDEEPHAGPSSGITGILTNAYGAKKNVQFNEQANTVIPDSYSSDIEVNPQFQHQDDAMRGHSRSTQTSTEGEQIPSHLHMKMKITMMKD